MFRRHIRAYIFQGKGLGGRGQPISLRHCTAGASPKRFSAGQSVESLKMAPHGFMSAHPYTDRPLKELHLRTYSTWEGPYAFPRMFRSARPAH